jgi:hypothetical protein
VDGSLDADADTTLMKSRIASEMNVSSPLEINIGGLFDSTSRSGQADIQIVATDPITNSNLKVRIAIIESRIVRTAPNGIAIHNQTFRDMVPGTNGIAITIAEGDTVNLTQAFSCPSPIVLANCDIVVIVQADTGHRILQGAKRNVLTMTYNLDPFALISPPNYDTVATCTTTFVWHRSNDPDSGYAMNYQGIVSFQPTFDTNFLVSDTLSDTTWSPTLCLPDDSTYYWKIVAFNGHAPARTCNTIFRFTVNETGPICDYVVGDANGNGSLNGLDVTYSVAYFKGGPPPPFECDCPPHGSWYVAGDVNQSCSFNGLDVTYMVAYFKGGPAPNPCPDCPSSRR